MNWNRKEMKIWYISDLHIDFGKQHIKEYPEVDIVVILGDVGNRMSGWAENSTANLLTNMII